jgi:hypothetical protein
VAFRVRNLRYRFAIQKQGLLQMHSVARGVKRTLQRLGLPI